jgi:DNA-binding response OmpR family regulator
MTAAAQPRQETMPMTKLEVLLIAGDGSRRRHIERQLRQFDCAVTTVDDAEQGVQQAVDRLPDVVMLDPELPDGDGLEICRRIRGQVRAGTEPVFMLTPHRDLGVGLAKTVDGALQSHRWGEIQALIGRLGTLEPTWTRVSNQGLEMDLRQHQASIDGRPLTLTPMEFRLLWTLASDCGNVYDREQLSRLCHRGKGARRVRTIDVHVKALRTKLADRADLIQTVHGVGYRFRDRSHGAPRSLDREAACG